MQLCQGFLSIKVRMDFNLETFMKKKTHQKYFKMWIFVGLERKIDLLSIVKKKKSSK